MTTKREQTRAAELKSERAEARAESERLAEKPLKLAAALTDEMHNGLAPTIYAWARAGARLDRQVRDIHAGWRGIVGPDAALDRINYHGPKPAHPLDGTRLPKALLDALGAIAALGRAGKLGQD